VQSGLGPREDRSQKGLYDMHGNVREWCLDDMRTYTANAAEDPRGPETLGGRRIQRGGDWVVSPWHCRAAFRI
jgi:formylglycine-generating enzyme required for sulfatase activity